MTLPDPPPGPHYGQRAKRSPRTLPWNHALEAAALTALTVGIIGALAWLTFGWVLLHP